MYNIYYISLLYQVSYITITMPTTSSIMLNKGYEIEHPGFISNLKGKALQSFTIRYDVDYRFLVDDINTYQIDAITSYT